MSKPPEKPRSSHYKGNNEGGYGNPPVSTQFKKGNKGGGRPKGPESINATMRKMLRGKVTRPDGTKIPMQKAIALAAQRAVLTEGVKGIDLALRLADMFEDKPAGEASPRRKMDLTVLNDAELYIFYSLSARASGNTERLSEAERGMKYLGICALVRREDGGMGIDPVEGSGWELRPSLPKPVDDDHTASNSYPENLWKRADTGDE